MSTVGDIIKNALMEIGAYSQGETVSAADSAFCLSKFNDLNDEWAAKSLSAYNVTFSQYTLTPNLSPHTIGPTGTFTVAQRPVIIESASVIIPGPTSPVDLPLNIRGDQWWAANQVKGLASTYPTDLYYSTDWPNGSLYFWPIPQTAYGVRLEVWGLLSQAANVATTFSLPPGYRKAITLTLAEELIVPFRSTLSQSQLSVLMEKARKARSYVEANNSEAPRQATRDAGMQSPRIQDSTFNYLSGSIVRGG